MDHGLAWQLYPGLLILLIAANGAPIAARQLLGGCDGRPIDGGHPFADGRPWLGPSKTWRGLLSGLAAPLLLTPLAGLDWGTGLLIGGGAMAGDLLASFLKRRLGIAPSGMAPGLDQVPESLLPLWLARERLGLDWLDLVVLTLLFVVLELALSRLAYRLHIRKHPW
ncbi:MAG TPA: CDP-archaeol synthase [Thiotrichales bacterium]|nr:CDP-archaeol synthase [Thiotrichales bacterium]